jgi:hypothetical protein
MTYEAFNSILGIIKVYRNAGYEYYLDIDNRYDETFDSKADYERFMRDNKAEFIGVDED